MLRPWPRSWVPPIPWLFPGLHKIVVNMGVGEATQNTKMLDPLVRDLGEICGQKPVVTKAKKSIAAFQSA